MFNALQATSLAVMMSASAAMACVTTAPLEIRDILLSDVVVVGFVVDYRIVDPDPDPHRGDLLNYARFYVRVTEVLLNNTKEKIGHRDVVPVTWDNSTFSEPAELGDGGGSNAFLIALRDPASPLPPMRTGSAFIAPTPEPEHYTVLQAPCSGAFIFEWDGLVAKALRQILTTERDKETEAKILSEFLFGN